MNNYVVGLLKNLYADDYGEIFCGMQLKTFYFTLLGKQSEFAQVFLNMCEDEVSHQKILGEKIVESGGEIDFDKNIINNLIFTKNIKEMLNFVIEIKEKSIINYKLSIAKMPEKDVALLLKKILIDEQKHIMVCRDLLEKYCQN